MSAVEVSELGVVSDEMNAGLKDLSLHTKAVVEGPVVVVDQILRAAVVRDAGGRSWQTTHLETSVKWSNLVESNMVW